MSDTAIPTAKSSWVAANYGRIALCGLLIAVVGAAVAILSGQGYQVGALPLLTAFAVLRYGAYVAVAGGVLSLISIILAIVLFRGEFLSRSAVAVVGLLVGVIAFYVPYSMQVTARAVPPIHDITTDTDNPPAFVDVLPLREASKARNVADYLRENKLGQRVLNVPEEQLKAYPDIKPILLAGVPASDAFGRALEAAKKHNWHIVAERPDEGRIEAWDKTPWFGFVDDVVIRVMPEGDGSRIDIRSLSRVGGSDVGKNAQRVRAYMQTLLSLKN